MDPISGSIAALAQTAQAPAASNSVVNPVADDMAAARFAAIMAQPAGVEPGAPAAVAAAAQAVAGSGAAGTTGSIGERILSGMASVSGEMQTAWNTVGEVVRRGESGMDLQGMLGVQMALVQVGIQYDLMGKVVTRSGQSIDQLVRLQ